MSRYLSSLEDAEIFNSTQRSEVSKEQCYLIWFGGTEHGAFGLTPQEAVANWKRDYIADFLAEHPGSTPPVLPSQVLIQPDTREWHEWESIDVP